ncbi:stage II sporulation protein P [Ureibacillus sinduriensis]|uniref:Stage II sporulation protein P n=1 Tax=Ureibacillus sinduriensis BLB-1 = JCM 15800 TaxID=1384057 RepID=A0A0A3HTG3_9BACL|nr:stage II sporulation protein P [Ureibacillus sinduriensis]KGR74515.1 stage II sporulation protein P [Ureibacillus sinduriensis BLB-1 = JCM 15800]
MLKKLKILSVFLVFFFMLPIITGLLPFPNNEKYEPPIAEEKQVVYASTNVQSEQSSEEVTATQVTTTDGAATEVIATEGSATDVKPAMDSFDVLFVFTHSQETYKPFAESQTGTVAVYDDKANLLSMSQVMEDYFKLNGLNATTLDVDIMAETVKQGKTMASSYSTARTFINQELKKKEYDLILDIHRDATGHKKSTISYNNVGYAKTAFVIGAENPNYKSNLTHANSLSQALNKIVPNISRGIIEKSGDGVDGVYNQDLSSNLLLIEIGGIDNTEDEVYRTIAVLAQAIANTFVNKEGNA